jgi:hypothetical protein
MRRRHWVLGWAAFALTLLFAVGAWAQGNQGNDQNSNQSSNIVQFGGSVVVPANQVVNNAAAIGGSVTISRGARVIDTAVSVGGNVVIQSGARVDGDAYAVGGNVVQEPGASIGGAVGNLPEGTRVQTDHRRWRGMDRVGSPVYFLNAVSHLSTAILGTVVGVLLLRWRPNFLHSLALVINHQPVGSALWGLGGVVVLIALNLFLLVSLIGIPLLPLVNLVAFCVFLVGALGVSLLIGEKVSGTAPRTPMQQFLIGMAIVAVVGLIPVLGGVFLAAVNLLGLGAILVVWLSRERSLPSSPSDT